MDKIWQRTQATRGFIYTKGNDKQDIPGNKQKTNQEKLQTDYKTALETGNRKRTKQNTI